MPMNIQKNRWSSLVGKRPEDMYDSSANIEASTILLRRKKDRLEKQTPEKIGTLWIALGAEYTNDFGNYIGELYKERPWKRVE